ncbi:GGDEF domain-containing protein [Mycobacterium avium subsp. paratuberculosis]|nr:putative diguanylate cyclase AdrA [Mycobacterium avium subsp. paratuberculosis]OVF05363.1 putative diguanylate cyclase AdrA [Mycobacterium avium subsp. paratuberculosis]CAG6852010.1 GGDEF domain-containing protein [Mycobacterium avium subsp. paratuberculosis]CAG6855876.1 GGDEF domain-containing protein [Mycobacterium avium subsp. paratuberculosis]CAG6864388.1 GGDEF domain-containing protein [Mycobacterium avium subsp. paratuberculosis]
MGRSLPHPSGDKDARPYRLRLRADAGSVFYRTQQARMLRIFLGATIFLYAYGVVFTLFPIRPGLTLSNPAGGIVAVGLGLGALAWLAARPDKPAPATVTAIVATPIVMAFHRVIIAEFVCLIAPMFLAMYLRAFYSPRRGAALVAVLAGLSVAALAVAPTPKLSIDYAIFVIAIIGAAESFGLLTRALVTAACTDPLTGLLNRAGWEIATADLLSRTRSATATVTVVALDIDNFKTLNDTEGHVAGDQYLVRCAAFWRQVAPAGAVLARFGGDEFAVCIADHHPTSAKADQFVASVRRHTPDISVGTASGAGASADIASLYAAADAELYSAKRRRRDPGLRPARG